ncbi:MAG: AAA family ATPase [Oscillospiraceae bacterium]
MNIPQLTEKIANETEKIILGKRDRIELIIMALLAEGHVLLDDMPGVGKTTLIKTLAIVSGCDTRRIQFVPDLLPSDITGMNIFNQKTGAFQMMRGPVFTNLLLADEVNRAVPRTQSALLEAMEERQVTIDGETMNLPVPFMVLSTQNPVESESTFRLPVAQMDRFLIKLTMGFPTRTEEKQMLFNLGDKMPFDSLSVVTSPEELAECQRAIAGVAVSDAVADYIVKLVSATRTNKLVKMGASPRASRSLYKAAKAWAAMQGREFVTPDDVQYLTHPVLDHRILLTNEARLSGKNTETVVEHVLKTTAVPPASGEVFDEKKD